MDSERTTQGRTQIALRGYGAPMALVVNSTEGTGRFAVLYLERAMARNSSLHKDRTTVLTVSFRFSAMMNDPSAPQGESEGGC
jgi:hypothetical protein